MYNPDIFIRIKVNRALMFLGKNYADFFFLPQCRLLKALTEDMLCMKTSLSSILHVNMQITLISETKKSHLQLVWTVLSL